MAEKKKVSTKSKDKTKKAKSKTGMTTRELMMKRKADLEKRGTGGPFIFPKDGVTRVRVKSAGSDKELGVEIIRFYLGKELGYVISPATFGDECPLFDKFNELRNSKKEADQDLAKELKPTRRFVVAGIGYKDDRGSEVDPDTVNKAYVVPRSVYQDIIELYLDEEQGDMTDPDEGYDIKITRSGSGKNDTSYSVLPCKPKALSRKYQGEVDLEGIIRSQIPEYDSLEETLEKWLNMDHDGDEEESAPKSKKKSSSKDSGHKKALNKKKKYKGDI